jgi:hypothetical protein
MTEAEARDLLRAHQGVGGLEARAPGWSAGGVAGEGVILSRPAGMAPPFAAPAMAP